MHSSSSERAGFPQPTGFGPLVRSSPLASGANNDIFLLEFPEGKVVFKHTRPGGTNLLQREASLLLHLGEDIGPRVLQPETPDPTDPSGSLILEYIQGEHRFELGRKDAALLGQALGSIHATDLSPLASFLESPSWKTYFQDRLMTQFLSAQEVAPSHQVREMDRCLEGIHAVGLDMESRLGEQGRGLVHTDLIPLNVIYQSDRCRVIDWELARIDFPEWDICSALKSFTLSAQAKEEFLDAYGRTPDPDRLRFVSLLHYANVALWRLCSFYRRGENQTIRDKFLRELAEEIQWIQGTLA